LFFITYYCQVGPIVVTAQTSFALAVDTGYRCTSLAQHVLDYYLLQLEEEGFFADLWQKYLLLTGDQNCVEPVDIDLKEKDDMDPSLTLRAAGGIFVIYYIISFFSLFIAYGNRYHRRHHNNENALETSIGDGSE